MAKSRDFEFPAFPGVGTAFRTAPVAELGVLHAELVDRVTEFDIRLPSEVTRSSRPAAIAVFAEAQALGQFAARLSGELKLCPPAELEDGFDFDFPDYERYECDVEEILAELEALPDSLFAPFAPPGPFVFTVGEESPALINAADDASTLSGIRKWVAKIFAALGIKEAYQAILELLDESVPHLMEELGRNLATKQWRAAKNVLKSLLRTISSSSFLRKLGEKIGVRAAGKLVGKIAAKFVPFLGWALVIGGIIWAIAEQFI